MPHAELSRQSDCRRDPPREQQGGLDAIVAGAQSQQGIARWHVGAELKREVTVPRGEGRELESRLKIA